MTKVYNTQEDIASGFAKFLQIADPDIRKTQLNIIPYILFGMIDAESLVAVDIAKHLKDEFSLVQLESVTKRIKRLFTNKYFEPYLFYDKVIRHVIASYKKKHADKRVHIILDHMFSHDNYTVFMITMRLGSQGIPLWFRCFHGNDDPQAFNENLLIEGISYVSNLFSNDFDLIFLADRWFNSISLMKHIDTLGHTYVFRLKHNLKVLHYDKKEEHKIWKTLNDLPTLKYHPVKFKDIELTEKKYKTNIVISDAINTDEPWILATNGNPNRAIKDYGYRFGGVESVFKNQKSNGFYLENTVNASLKYFESMYTLACTAILYLTILGSDFAKNRRCYRKIKIKTHVTTKGTKKRTMSLYNTGLTLFHKAFHSLMYIRLPFTFILYDS